MIKWYADEKMAIMFSEKPDPQVLCPGPETTEDEAKEMKKKPFLNPSEFTVVLFDHTKYKKYIFKATKDYRWDGASIPRLFWRLVGAGSDPRYLIPSLIHDLLCENKNFVNYDRYFSTCVFERLLYVSKVPAFIRWEMKHSVDNFQKFQHWEAPKEKTGSSGIGGGK